MYEGWRSTLNECYSLPSYVLRQVFLLTLQLAVLERLAGVWLGSGWGLAGGWLGAGWGLAAGWLDSYSQRSTRLCPPSTGFTDEHLNTWICSLCRCWESELMSPGLHRESDFPSEPSPSHFCLSLSLPVFCSTSVLYQDTALVLCEAGFSFFLFLLRLPFLPLTEFH